MKKKNESAGRIEPMVIHDLPVGLVIYVEGIPFELVSTCKIKSNKRNFIIANIIMDDKNIG